MLAVILKAALVLSSIITASLVLSLGVLRVVSLPGADVRALAAVVEVAAAVHIVACAEVEGAGDSPGEQGASLRIYISSPSVAVLRIF